MAHRPGLVETSPESQGPSDYGGINKMQAILYLAIGFVGGIASGAFGIGGGAVMVPALVYFCHLTQHQAQGTVLALLMVPVSILAVLRYYHSGNVNIPIAVFMAIGFIGGALWGAHFIHGISDANLKRAFGVFLVMVGLEMALVK